MNKVILIGRLTKDPEIRYTASTQMAVARFNLAIERPTTKDKDKQTDFPVVKVFGKQAEACERYLAKGLKVGIEGRVQTGKYETSEGRTVYTTEVIAERIEFIEWKNKKEESTEYESQTDTYEAPDGFESVDEDVPF